LLDLAGAGYKFRSRALTTTMYARLYLADLFIHGIGGGIYDELTDRIMERYFAMPAPAFLVISATLLLPLPRFPDAANRLRTLSRQLRDLNFKPERFVERSQIAPLIPAKQEWIQRDGTTHAARVERFHAIRALNAQMHPFVQPQIEHVQSEIRELRRQMKWDEVAARRDYAFCLYPEEMLRSFFQSGRWMS
jgi:hypothetical protein